jgi:hypothetical protein
MRLRGEGGVGLLAALAVAALTGAGCKPSAPTSFGVDVTVNAKNLSSADLAKVTTGSLLVSGAEPQAKRFPVGSAISSGQLTFQYVPTVTSGTLTFQFEALDASGHLYGTGTGGPVTLVAGAAVPVTITLTAQGGTLSGLGANCTTAATCSSGFCTDNVCCESACKDTCASCALKNTTGLCAGYPANTDPEGECTGSSMTTGAGGSGGKGGAGGAGGAKTDASAPMDASASDAEAINPPDGGIVLTPTSCGGTCSGMKTCTAFAGAGSSCGQPFCNTHRDVGSPICDGNGNCGIGLTTCTTGYGCDPTTKPVATCHTNCNSNGDCTVNYYCAGSNMCEPTKVDGLTCTTGAECLHGHCIGAATGVNGVCCNTACDSPNTCNDQGSAGTCKCPGLKCNTGVSCTVFYPDVDGDGYGDRSASLASTSNPAVAGCADTPPANHVADNTDCDDHDANVHPGQTAFFSTESNGTKTFDYDCDGVFEKGLPEYPGATCSFCPDGCTVACTAASSTTCGAASTKASLNCTKSEGTLCSVRILQSASEIAEAISVQPPITRLTPVCCGCATTDEAGFNAAVDCGQTGNYVTCGSCTAAMGAVVGTTTSTTVKQTCH